MLSDTEHILEQLALLADAGLPLIQACRQGLGAAITWIVHCNKLRTPKGPRPQVAPIEEITGLLQSALDDFHVSRLVAVKPYRHVFDPAHPPSDEIDYRKVGLRPEHYLTVS